MKEDFIRNRITELRIKKNVSEYKMSYDIGHSKGYIQSISSGRTMPSMSEFLYICDYFGITPQQFFDEAQENPELINKATDILCRLDESDLRLVISVAERLVKK